MVLFPCFYSIVITHRNCNFPLFFHCFTRVLRDNGPTSKPQFFHCFSTPSISILLLLFYLESFSKRSTQIFHYFFFPLFYMLSIYSSISSIFPVFCHSVTRFLHHYPSIISVCLTLTQMPLPQSLPLHRINGFARFFHGFISVLLLHSDHTSKLQFFHCFSIVSRVLYAIMVPHRSLNFSIVFPPHQFPSFYFYFTWNHFPSVLLKFSILFPLFYMLSIYSSISSIFPVFCHGVTRFLHYYPYVTPVCLTLTQVHLPQSLQLHRINGFARFFHGFLSVLLLHSGHTSKLQFFHCFSIVSRVLYAIMVPHRSLNFTWHHFTLSLFFPPFLLAF